MFLTPIELSHKVLVNLVSICFNEFKGQVILCMAKYFMVQLSIKCFKYAVLI